MEIMDKKIFARREQVQEKLNKYYQKPDIYSSIAINGTSIRLEMTAAQSYFLSKLAIKNNGKE